MTNKQKDQCRRLLERAFTMIDSGVVGDPNRDGFDIRLNAGLSTSMLPELSVSVTRRVPRDEPAGVATS